MVLYSAIHLNLTDRIEELEKEILNREDKMCEIEAKVFHDHLLALHDRLIAYEIQFEANVTDYTYLTTHLRVLRPYHLKVIDLQIKLTKIFTPTTASKTKTKVINLFDHQNEDLELEIVEKLHARIQKQNFLIRQIDSVQTNEDICPGKAEVLYNHIGRLYDTFISNQVQIETLVEKDPSLFSQQKITAEVQQKVIDFQTKMNKIITPTASKSPTKFDSDQIDDDEIIHTDSSDLDVLFKKRESTINRMTSLDQKDNLSPEKAEILYQHLTPLYQSFISDQNEIETLVSGTLLEAQQEISRQIQNKVIELQTTFKKLFAPATSSSTTELKTCSDLIALFNELFISDQTGNGNSRITHHNQLEISRDIHRKLNCLQSTLNRILSSSAVSTYLKEINVTEQSIEAQTSSSQTSIVVENNDKRNLALKRPRMSILDEPFSRE
ncbi:uncharacterized protein LOC135843178 [Planococcus citri]|uniref:uncharacterized protein LOC135843178 n=1 Tax=Planococcus citri TaxID=170843 RepID=UPI0031F76FEF